ncbi:hypothetical protein [Bifidobacterium choladohabitans]|uniref:hypothetical protein n=1 Tax=Bifidobacterium choladohabitans TaxID=2750947 RepID=UPI0018DCE8B2|nr:hypothetical protein [Bifidobacterium choladohabitans]MBI0048697.1 hypothetical protein [Bifidobacterium choladohabitans]
MVMMSESSCGGVGAGGVSDGAGDRVDAFVLSSVMSRVVGSVPHARPGAREFSLGGVLWKTVLYGLTYVAGVACGWLLLIDDSQDRVRALIAYSGLLGLFSIFAVAFLLGRYEDGKGCPGPWFVVLSFPFAPGFGVVFGAAGRTSGGVFRWILVSVSVLVVVGVLVFPVVMRLVRNGFLSWAAMVVLCVVPSWMLARVTGSAGASLFWCCVVGVVGALWFVLDMWAIGKCAGTHRDAAFEWLAAWALVFDLIMLIASLLGASKDDDDASR